MDVFGADRALEDVETKLLVEAEQLLDRELVQDAVRRDRVFETATDVPRDDADAVPGRAVGGGGWGFGGSVGVGFGAGEEGFDCWIASALARLVLICLSVDEEDWGCDVWSGTYQAHSRRKCPNRSPRTTKY